MDFRASSEKALGSGSWILVFPQYLYMHDPNLLGMEIRSADGGAAGGAPSGTAPMQSRRLLLIVIVAVVIVVIAIGGYYALQMSGSGGNGTGGSNGGGGSNGSNGTSQVLITGMDIKYTGSSCGFPASQDLNASQIASFTILTTLPTTAQLTSDPTLSVQGSNCVIESASVTAGGGFTGTVSLFMGGNFPYNYTAAQYGVGGIELLIQGTFTSGYNGPLNVAIKTN